MVEQLPITVFLRVKIIDPVGDKALYVDLPADVPVRQLLPQLLSDLGLQETQQPRSFQSFFLWHERTRRHLELRETLRDAGVQARDVLRVVPAPHVDPGVGPCGLVIYKLDRYLHDTLPGEYPDLSISFPQPEGDFVEAWSHHATASRVMEMDGELFRVTISVSRLE